MDTLLPLGSMERREYDLPEHLKDALAYYRSKLSEINHRLENHQPGAAYAALLDGTLHRPTMPKVLRHALGLSNAPILTSEMTTAQANGAWIDYAQGMQL